MTSSEARGQAESDGARVVVPRPGARVRGDRRRAELVDAGVQVLAERGWAGMTARAVAERAGAQLGLVHYHFGGFPQLKRAVAVAVLDGMFEPVLEAVAGHERWADGLSAAVRAAEGAAAGSGGRLGAEVVVAALGDEAVREELAEALADARERMAQVLTAAGAPRGDAQGLAVVAVGLLDGLVLHRLVDPGLSLDDAADAVARLG